MTPAGAILTYMSRQDFKGKSFWVKLRTFFFNLILFVFQLTFLVVGTAWGKIKWEKRRSTWGDTLIVWLFLIPYWCIPAWWNIPVVIAFLFTVVAIFRNIPWRRVWRAAKASHVRLCLEEVSSVTTTIAHSRKTRASLWRYINFGYPSAQIEEYWRPGLCDGKYLEYREPTFDPSDEFIAAMIEYAYKQRGKRYDQLQLFSFGLNFIVWLFWWPLWGREVFRWLNLRGGREVCSSGVTACLRWGEKIQCWDGCLFCGRRQSSKYFKGYDTAVVPPCLVPLSEDWIIKSSEG